MTSLPGFSTSNRVRVAGFSAILMGAFAVDLATPRGFSDWVLYLIVLIAATRAVGSRSLKILAGVASGCTVLGLVFSPHGQPIWVSTLGPSFALLLIWAIVGMELNWRKRDERLRRLEKAVEGSNDIVFMTDPKGTITFINPVFTDTYGYRADEVLDKTTPRILKGGHVDAEAYKVFWEMLLEKHPVRGEFINKTKDGRLLTLDVSASAILDASGNITGFLGIQRDITEHKQAKHLLETSEERLRLAVQAASLSIWDWDVTTNRMTLSGTSLETLLGLQPGAFPQSLEGFISLIHPEDRELVEGSVQRALTQGTEYDIEFRFLRTNGTDLWISARGQAFRDATGNPVRVIGVARDITGRKRAEKALLTSEAQYRRLFEAAKDGILILDEATGEITDANPFLTDLIGYPKEAVIGKKLWELGVFKDIFASQLNFEELQREAYIRYENLPLRRSDGRPIAVEFVSNVYPVDGMKVIQCNIRDITERSEAAKELKKTQEQFLQVQKMEAVGRLAGGVAHDFNNLLTIINGYCELMLGSAPAGSPDRSHLEEIRHAGERAAALTRQLLAFSRKQVVAPAILDLNVIVEGAEKMLRRLIGEDIKLVTDFAKNLGPIKADPGQIEQVLMNLVVNARDAMPKGGNLTIETSNTELGDDYARSHAYVAPGEYVMLAMSDTGCGMDAETQSHIFEPFYTTKELGKGTGLGLSTVYGIVKQSGGHVQVYSEVGKGTTFRIYFPRMGQLGELDRVRTAESVPVSGTETILLVEDEPGVRNLAQKVLQSQGYTVLTAGAPDEALQRADQHQGKINLLITDVVMPGMNGKDLADRLTLSRPGMPVLFISGYTADAIGHHGILDKGVAFLPKPFTPRDLLRNTRQTLDGKEA